MLLCAEGANGPDTILHMLVTCRDDLPAGLTLSRRGHAAVGAAVGATVDRRASKASSQVSCRGLIQ